MAAVGSGMSVQGVISTGLLLVILGAVIGGRAGEVLLILGILDLLGIVSL